MSLATTASAQSEIAAIRPHGYMSRADVENAGRIVLAGNKKNQETIDMAFSRLLDVVEQDSPNTQLAASLAFRAANMERIRLGADVNERYGEMFRQVVKAAKRRPTILS